LTPIMLRAPTKRRRRTIANRLARLASMRLSPRCCHRQSQTKKKKIAVGQAMQDQGKVWRWWATFRSERGPAGLARPNRGMRWCWRAGNPGGASLHRRPRPHWCAVDLRCLYRNQSPAFSRRHSDDSMAILFSGVSPTTVRGHFPLGAAKAACPQSDYRRPPAMAFFQLPRFVVTTACAAEIHHLFGYYWIIVFRVR